MITSFIMLGSRLVNLTEGSNYMVKKNDEVVNLIVKEIALEGR